MAEFTLLIVDPDVDRRKTLAKTLGSRFKVHVSPTASDGLSYFESHYTMAVIASLRQDIGHGLQFCRLLREQTNGEKSFFVVYGKPKGEVRAKEELERRWHVDAFLPFVVNGEVLEPLLWHELARRSGTDKRAGKAPSRPAPGLRPDPHGNDLVENMSRALSQPTRPTARESKSSAFKGMLQREIKLDRLKDALLKEYHLFPHSPLRSEKNPSDLSWFDLLNSSANQDVIRALLTRDIFGTVKSGNETGEMAAPASGGFPVPNESGTLEETAVPAVMQAVDLEVGVEEDLSWKDLLTSDATPSNLVKLLKKDVRIFT